MGHHLLSGQVEGTHQPCEHPPHGHIPPHATPLDATCATDGPFPLLYTTLPQAPSSSALQPQESPQVQESRRPLFRQLATSVSRAAGLQRLTFTNSMNLALHPLHHSDQSCAVMPLIRESGHRCAARAQFHFCASKLLLVKRRMTAAPTPSPTIATTSSPYEKSSSSESYLRAGATRV